jgi:hypothetical protein
MSLGRQIHDWLERTKYGEEEHLRREGQRRRAQRKRKLASVPPVRVDMAKMLDLLSPRDYRILQYALDKEGYLLKQQPKPNKDGVRSSARLVWKFLRYYFSAVDEEEMEAYPMDAVRDLNPNLRDNCTALFDLCKRIAKAITIWPEPQRYGQFWHHQVLQPKKKKR